MRKNQSEDEEAGEEEETEEANLRLFHRMRKNQSEF